MKIIGYVARYADGKYAHPYGERRSIKLYLREATARQHNKKAEVFPVFVEEPPRICYSCTRPENDHHVRHPFLPYPE